MNRYPLQPGDDNDPRQSESLNDSAAETARGAKGPVRLAEFERIYRSQFGTVVAYFARRYEDPQLVADLTADTFVAAIQAFAAPGPRAASPRAWTIGIARRIWMRHRGSDPRGESPSRRRSLERLLDADETKELMWQIDLERSSRELVERLQRMPPLDREALELVELCELSPVEAARELGISAEALRVRLQRSQERLGHEGGEGG